MGGLKARHHGPAPGPQDSSEKNSNCVRDKFSRAIRGTQTFGSQTRPAPVPVLLMRPTLSPQRCPSPHSVEVHCLNRPLCALNHWCGRVQLFVRLADEAVVTANPVPSSSRALLPVSVPVPGIEASLEASGGTKSRSRTLSLGPLEVQWEARLELASGPIPPPPARQTHTRNPVFPRFHPLNQNRCYHKGGGGGPITVSYLMNSEFGSNLQVQWVKLSVGHWRTAADPLLCISVAHPQASSCLLFCDRKVPMVL